MNIPVHQERVVVTTRGRRPARSAHSLHQLLMAAAICCTFNPQQSSAATITPILAYSFDQGELFRASADLQATGLLANVWTTVVGTGTSATGNPGRAISASRWDGDGNAFVLRVNLLPGHTLSLTGFGFDERASGTGAQQWLLRIAELDLAQGRTHTAFTRHAGLVSLPGSLSGQFDIVLSGWGASSGSGTWRMDNFFLEGQVLGPTGVATQIIPLPPALALLAGPLLLCPRRRRTELTQPAEASARQLRQPRSSGK
ncbi:MAG TPA: hypothetical protein DCY89_07490 [Gammaproteobacteria bacterium]|nr:hypothetical protein [Gammaproteobacteria bacterium]